MTDSSDPFAGPDDVAARWRPLTSAETTIAATLCGDASALIRQRFPGIDGQVTTGQVDLNILTMVCSGMVRRAMVGGSDGISQETKTLGNATIGVSYANPLGNVFLTEPDLTLILGYQQTAVSSRFTNTTCHREDGGAGFVYLTGP